MVNVWIHKPGDGEPFLAASVSVAEAIRAFDLDSAVFIAPLGGKAPRLTEPEPLLDDPDPEAVVFEVLAREENGAAKAGYYASGMTADTVQELLAEEWAKGTGQAGGN